MTQFTHSFNYSVKGQFENSFSFLISDCTASTKCSAVRVQVQQCPRRHQVGVRGWEEAADAGDAGRCPRLCQQDSSHGDSSPGPDTETLLHEELWGNGMSCVLVLVWIGIQKSLWVALGFFFNIVILVLISETVLDVLDVTTINSTNSSSCFMVMWNIQLVHLKSHQLRLGRMSGPGVGETGICCAELCPLSCQDPLIMASRFALIIIHCVISVLIGFNNVIQCLEHFSVCAFSHVTLQCHDSTEILFKVLTQLGEGDFYWVHLIPRYKWMASRTSSRR